MRPDILAEHLATTIRNIVTPLIKQIEELQVTVNRLKVRDDRHGDAIAELQKSHREYSRAAAILESLDAGDSRH